jgi:steroid delta-isomerase-like uncharacterized protein
MLSKAVQQFVDRFNAVFNRPDLNIIDDIFLPDFVWHPAGLPDMDRAGLKGFCGMFYEGFPDLRQEVLDVISTEDRLVLRVVYRGTHSSTFQGIPATDRSIQMAGTGIFRLVDGKCIENWAILDMFSLMQQIGAVSMPNQG